MSARSRNWRLARWGAAGLILLAPLIATLFTGEMNWGLGDFVIFGAMLAAALYAYELAASLISSTAYRTVLALTIAMAFFVLWLHLAVGILAE